jgi:hypothetical protein
MKRSAQPLPSGARMKAGEGEGRPPLVRGRPERAEPGDLALEVAGHVLASVIVADAEALGGVPFDAAEAIGDALPDRLQRLVPGAVQGGMDADALGRAMVDGDEHCDLAHAPP